MPDNEQVKYDRFLSYVAEFAAKAQCGITKTETGEIISLDARRVMERAREYLTIFLGASGDWHDSHNSDGMVPPPNPTGWPTLEARKDFPTDSGILLACHYATIWATHDKRKGTKLGDIRVVRPGDNEKRHLGKAGVGWLMMKELLYMSICAQEAGYDRGTVSEALRAVQRDLIKHCRAPDERPSDSPKTYVFSPDFRSGNWYGIRCNFTHKEAEIVAILVEAFEAKVPDVDAGALLGLSNDARKAKDKKESYAKRVRDIFRGNPAFDTVIMPGQGRGRKGTYHLEPPQTTA